ncbi:MAG: hypothetical protein Q8Q29_03995, partial [Actinomycetota bacterium]|nr:hypothetical protein [Actinomycetota bacterium]
GQQITMQGSGTISTDKKGRMRVKYGPEHTLRNPNPRKHDPFTGGKLTRAEKKLRKRIRQAAKFAGERSLADVDLGVTEAPIEPTGPTQLYGPVSES